MDGQQAADLLDDDLARRLNGPVAIVAALPLTLPTPGFLMQSTVASMGENKTTQGTDISTK